MLHVARESLHAPTASLGAPRRVATAKAIEAAAWAAYVPAFLDEMRASYRLHRREWEALLARDAAVLCCYCVDPARCHRAILRARILPALGAIDEGELAA